ncbi:MAG: ribosome biogenesis GTPase Der [Planctomycetota bacterium]
MIPRIAIVGRPNVGKSTLLNRLARRRVSIVHPRPGVTRDRVAVDVNMDGHTIEVFDTGGIGIVDDQNLDEQVDIQIHVAIESAHLILFLVDARVGVQTLDLEVAHQLRQHGANVLLIANKCEADRAEYNLGDFYQLGFGAALPLSAEHGLGIEDLVPAILERLGGLGKEERRELPMLKIAVVGRRNAGKSTFINSALQEERMIASEIPGTTRDAVDIRFEKDGKEFLIIDTAGLHRRSKLKDDVDYYAQVRALDAIRRADVVILLLDAQEGVAQIDKRVAREIIDEHKVCVIGLNKWDLVKDKTTPDEYSNFLQEHLPGLYYAPVVALTAKEGRKVWETLGLAQALAKQAQVRVGTGELNRALEVIRRAPTPRIRGAREPRIYYGTQVAVLPPTISLFVNDPGNFSSNYQRKIEHQLRELLPFREVPVKVLYRSRSREDEPE